MIDTISVIIMAKLPRTGLVKTRLQPDLSADQAAEVHRAMLLHTVRRVAAMRLGRLIVCFDPPGDSAAAAGLFDGLPVHLLPQAPGDLGQRIAAVRRSIAGPILLLGVDSPDVPPDHLKGAAALAASRDVVLGPTEDGGFWCLGLSERVDADALLAGIDWSSGRELDQTAAAAQRLGLSVALAGRWDDVDRPDDLRRLIDRLGRSADCAEAELRRSLQEILQR